MKNIAIFASGTGTNFLAIHKAIQENLLDANLCLFITDNPKSEAFKKAKNFNIESFAFEPKKYASKKDYETVIVSKLKGLNIDLIVLAGYMRIIGESILKQYPKKIINIHPSLLPHFKGKDAVGQALDAGVLKTGVTVHYVDEGIDTGEIILQEEVKILSHYNRDQLESIIHSIEHKLYFVAIKKVLEEQE